LTVRPKYLDVFKDRHGKQRVYFRRGRGARIELPPLDSPEFLDAYAKALAGSGSPAPKSGSAIKESILALVAEYYASPDFRKNKASSQRVTRSILDRFVEKHGDFPVKGLQYKHVTKLMGRMADKPGAANMFLTKLRALMGFAIKMGWRTDDPTYKVARYKQGTHHTWTDAELTKFEAKWPLGSRERTAYALALYTGQRRSDLAEMSWGHYDPAAGTISVAQIKGDMANRDERLIIPVHRDLRTALEAWPRYHMTILASARTKGMSAASFGNFMAEAIEAAGLPERCVLHGLRKAAARRLAEAGCSVKEIQAITGHKTLNEVERYTRAADQKRLAQAAIVRLEARNEMGTANPKPPECSQTPEKS
jgi:integrase